MEGPVVIRLYKSPSLYRTTDLDWVLLDVANRSPYIIRTIKKDAPPASAPDRMLKVKEPTLAKHIVANDFGRAASDIVR